MGNALQRLLGLFRSHRAARQISVDELTTAMAAPRPPVLLDVRSRQQYAEGHLPGAIHVPFDRLAEAARLLDRGRPWVVY
jgi:rhodanese-related sulfurtransferase